VTPCRPSAPKAVPRTRSCVNLWPMPPPCDGQGILSLARGAKRKYGRGSYSLSRGVCLQLSV
jgi:hypothetical protein